MALKRLSPQILLLIGIISAVVLIALPTLTYPLGRDQGEFATIGRGLLDGRIPYVDLWNPKPPAVFYVYALAMSLFGRTTAALRAIDLLIFPPIAAALYWIGKQIASARIGLWAALLFGVFYFAETFWTLTQNDGIALLPMVLAVACALKAAAADRHSARWAFAAGALTAYTIWFKYPFVFHVGSVVFAYGWYRAHNRVSLRWRDAVGFALGALLIGGGGIAYLMAIGAWGALLESARVTTSYTLLGLSDVGAALSTALGFRLQSWDALLILVGIALVTALRQFRRSAGRSLWWIVIVWLVAAAAMLSVQVKFYDYHFLPLLPPLVLIGGAGVESGIGFMASFRWRGRGGIDARSSRLRGLFALVMLAALAAVVGSRTLPYLLGQEDQVAYYHQFQAGEFLADESLQVAEYLRARVEPGDSLFIWGFRPEVYYLSQLNPAVRFIFQFPLVADWYPPEWRDQTVEILWAALPPYVLVLQGDYMPWVTGSDEDSNTTLQAYTELNNWLEFNYERDTQIGNFLIWHRISKPK